MTQTRTRRNVFSHVHTPSELDFEYMVASSPENVTCDGELSPEVAAKTYEMLRSDYAARMNELCGL